VYREWAINKFAKALQTEHPVLLLLGAHTDQPDMVAYDSLVLIVSLL
jgi:hypothetical protein